MRVHLGLGSNLGDRLTNLAEALRHIDDLVGTAVLGVSNVVQSVAWPDPAGPAYANAVALIDTHFDTDLLLGELQDIELAMGRDHNAGRNAPRTIDIDILLAGQDEWLRDDFTVPHPRMAERDFVITPLLELDPSVRWPDGEPVTRALVSQGKVTDSLGPVPGFEDVTAGSIAGAGFAGRTPMSVPAEDAWVPVFEHPTASGFVGAPPTFTYTAMRPDARTPLVQMILEQEGIPFVWDPFDPSSSTDPYGLPRPFNMMVPASMAARARKLIEDVLAAPFDGS